MLNDSPLHRDAVTSIDFHPSKPLLLTSSNDGTIAVCEADTRDLKYTLQCHMAAVHNIHWAVDGSAFSSVGGDNRVVLWDEPVVEHVPYVAEPINRNKPRAATRQPLTKFNEPVPREEPPIPEPEVGLSGVIRVDEADRMKPYLLMMHRMTDQIANLSKLLSKIEQRMNVMDEEIALLEIDKRKQASKVLQNRKI
jgi:hypothetical protein